MGDDSKALKVGVWARRLDGKGRDHLGSFATQKAADDYIKEHGQHVPGIVECGEPVQPEAAAK